MAATPLGSRRQPAVPALRLVRWGPADLAARRDDVLDVYAAAMEVDRHAARSRRSILTSHLDHPGLRAVAVLDGRDRLLATGYGYLGHAGQWWHDQVSDAVGPLLTAEWLDGAFEVCELHVLPDRQGQGLGKAVLDCLLQGVAAPAAVLTTPDLETRARGFYRSQGWQDLARGLTFPGDPRPFAVLGLRLPGG